ncbi:UvrD-helicase domain-containing protein [Budviciaceae bacterium CWB-B4]|uniref:UvrD-helicase domain-containing protein n=1 Tax=Limnobaculum xujianqingii TaxID=2738837 RepID=A0A9D7FQ65_9GAMM|nr:UvrD-helicase domain-containing protein [Limnobaculum xujianqingii]MBK5071549.1 UvrD-helicase domain-containing protein [Limnobaculum xujianqingii]MBK5174858.1 UvrD-helicase domain-containing protein [Limnobaculum xujianqingii]
MPVDLISSSNKAIIIAPAGCGKTQLIVKTLQIPTCKPYLVLTHTTAGVTALFQRLKSLGIPRKKYHIATIAGWALNVAKMFPNSTSYTPPIDSPPDYPLLQQAVSYLCDTEYMHDLLRSSYSRVLVDEYQDCSVTQHSLIQSLSKSLPTIVFGDPMQAIFGFNRTDPLPLWSDVIDSFSDSLLLNQPWRWNNVNKYELGQWILFVRNELSTGKLIDLNNTPKDVLFHPLSGNENLDTQKQIQIQYSLRSSIPKNESLLIIGDSRNVSSRHNFAKMSNGLEVVEPVDLRDILMASRNIDNYHGDILLEQILTISSNLMTGIDSRGIIQRLKSINAGRNRIAPSNIEILANSIVHNGLKKDILTLLIELEKMPTTKVFRRTALSVLKDALSLSISDKNKSILEAASIIREQRRSYGEKRIHSRSIGSTLLLKGLEADHVFILDATYMTAQHLYVALSRGAKSITICSQNSLIGN